jgi:hypothetical protein
VGGQGERVGKERILRGEEDGRQHNEIHQTLYEKGGRRERGSGKTMEGVNSFKVYCTRVELSQ